MHGPALSGWLLVALCAASGAYCLARARACAGKQRRAERRAAGGEAVMGFGMAAMALPATVLTPPAWGWTVYAAVFGAAALHGLAGAARGHGPGGGAGDRGGRGGGGHHLHHLVGSLAMLYMAVAMAAPAGAGAHAGHAAAATAGGIPVLTGGLLLYYGAYVVRAGGRLVPVAVTAGGPPPTGAHPPELTLVCRLSMALAMLAMLVTL
ncbi:DUF5134 domain-containing protein [Streptomyces sp. NPDC003327]